MLGFVIGLIMGFAIGLLVYRNNVNTLKDSEETLKNKITVLEEEIKKANS